MSPPEPPKGGALAWDHRYREGTDAWELGQPAPPLQAFLQHHALAPEPPGRVLVPGCGRGHEAALLAAAGFAAVGLDFSAAALAEAERLHGSGPALQWLQADLFDPAALAAAGLTPGSLQGVLEHTCFCAIDPSQRSTYLTTVQELLAPGGWLLGLFWCHPRPGGPPYGAEAWALARQFEQAGFSKVCWEAAVGSASGRNGQPRDHEWLGLWRR
jgi:SAM-dependent methyltransferase